MSGQLLEDGTFILFEENFVEGHQSLMEYLEGVLPLRAETLRFGGKEVLMPRLTSWHGDRSYSYSGKKFKPSPWHNELLTIRDKLDILLAVKFNSVLVNYYRDGKDSIAWHSDDEPEIDDAFIASVSLGAPRKFVLKNKSNSRLKHEFMLGNGSLLVMCKCQKTWQHCVPKTAKPVGPRMNLTYRVVR